MCLNGLLSRSTFFLAVLGLLAVLPAQGQEPAFQVRDLNVDWPSPPKDSGLPGCEGVGSLFYFVANDEIHGEELWRSDGTPAGTFLLKDARPGAYSSSPVFLTGSNGLLFFIAKTSGKTRDPGTANLDLVLWKSDGTPEGTSPVKGESFPGTGNGLLDEILMIDAGGKLLFVAPSTDSTVELWVTDGTEAGTQPVGDAARGFSSVYMFLAAGNGQVLFAADHGSGLEPWVTDGTNSGTHQVADLNPGPDSSISRYDFYNTIKRYALAAPWGGFVFVADDAVHGQEIWRTDGTAAGTSLIKDISTGPSSSNLGWLTVVNGKVVFADTWQAWATDGTEAGTLPLGSFRPTDITAVGSRAFFSASDGAHGRELWVTDGTPAGTRLVKDLAPGTADAFSESPLYFANLGGRLIFYSSGAGATFWTSDGTEAGTLPLTPSSAPWPYIQPLEPYKTDRYGAAGGRFFFLGDIQRSVWITDGTPAGSYRVLDIPSQTSSFAVQPYYSDGPRLDPESMADLGGTLFFQATDTATEMPSDPVPYFAFNYELWRSDGTAANTRQVKDLTGDSIPSCPHWFHVINDRLVFLTCNEDGLGLSDGTEAGTMIVPDLSVVDFAAKPLGHQLFFWTEEYGNAPPGGLWKTDGTEAGTVLVEAAPPVVDLTISGGQLFYWHVDDLWVSDGTGIGTIIGPGLNPQNLTDVGGTLFFNSVNYETPLESYTLWKSDGTPEGTVQVSEVSVIPPSNKGFPRNSGKFPVLPSGIVLFLSDDGTHGRELWRSDGTNAGTVLVKDIRPGLADAQVYDLTVAGSRAFFVADEGVHGRELWVTDGTEAGTHLVRDIVPGAGSSLPYNLAAAGSTLVFTAFDPVYGVEAWRSDGTAVGTRRLANIAPGPLSSSPLNYVLSGNNLFFVANDNTTGFELWAVPKTSALAMFGDVPTDYWSWRFIEALAANGVTGGCADGQFCPTDFVNRAQMAVFILAARDGVPPPPATGTRFADIPPGYWAGPWIEELAREGVTGGCSTTPPMYCPDHVLTRAEMAVLLTAARHETPPPATGTRFADVPADYWAAPWIEQLAADGITAGCGGGNYCPDLPITRGEMAVFLTTAFHLPMP